MSDPSNNNGFFGPSYNYAKHIRSPEDLQLMVSGNMWEFGNDIAAIGDYISVLIFGPSRANIYPERPLGMSYIMPTVSKCTNIESDVSGSLVQRSIYVNNIPLGNIPILTDATGVDLVQFRGLIPGIAQNLRVLDPYYLYKGMVNDGAPPCMKVELPTIDASGIINVESGYITIDDLEHIDPCAIAQVSDYYKNFNKKVAFKGKVKCNAPLVESCSCPKGTENIITPKPGYTSGYVGPNNLEGFNNINNKNIFDNIFNEKNLTELWIIILSIIGLYILLKVCTKQKI